MTKAKIDYSKSKIYRIESINEINSEVYIGSTTKQYLSQRLSKHKTGYRQWKKGAPHESHVTSFDIFDKYGIGNCKIVLIENYPCTTVEELRRREGYYIKHIKCVNKLIAGNTKQNYRDTHSVQIKQQMKQYYQTHAEQKRQYNQTHAEQIKQRSSELIECECGSTHQRSTKAQHMRTNKHIDFLETQKQAENVDILLN